LPLLVQQLLLGHWRLLDWQAPRHCRCCCCLLLLLPHHLPVAWLVRQMLVPDPLQALLLLLLPRWQLLLALPAVSLVLLLVCCCCCFLQVLSGCLAALLGLTLGPQG
jgi:hypothetical protein